MGLLECRDGFIRNRDTVARVLQPKKGTMIAAAILHCLGLFDCFVTAVATVQFFFQLDIKKIII